MGRGKHPPAVMVSKRYAEYLEGVAGDDLNSITDAGDRMELRQGKYGGAWRCYEAIRDHLGLGDLLPPPLVSVEDEFDWEWIQAGRELRRLNASGFYRLMSILAQERDLAQEMARVESIDLEDALELESFIDEQLTRLSDVNQQT